MSLFIPDPRWEMPELLVPWRKPTGPVVVDWSHPLISRSNVRHVFIMSQPGKLVDIAGTSNATVTDGEFGAQRLYFPGNTGNTAKLDADIGWSGDYTVIVKGEYFGTGGGTYPAIWGKGDTGSGEGMLRINGTAMQWLSELDVPGTIDPYPTGKFVVACVFDADGAIHSERYKMYLNGIDQSVVGTASQPMTSTKAFEVGNADSGVATNRAWKGWVDYCYVFFSALSGDDVMRLYKDPYAFLIPA